MDEQSKKHLSTIIIGYVIFLVWISIGIFLIKLDTLAIYGGAVISLLYVGEWIKLIRYCLSQKKYLKALLYFLILPIIWIAITSLWGMLAF